MYYFYSFLVFVSFFAGCSTDPGSSKQLNVKGSFSESSLSQQKIFELIENKEGLYAGTDRGLFQTKVETEITNWTLLFRQKGVYDFVIWNRQKILIGTPISNSQEASIMMTANGGDSWVPYQNDFGSEDQNNHLFVVEKHPKNPEKLFARGDFNVAMSPNSGETWQNLLGSWNGFGDGRFLTIAQSNPQIIWAGGATATFAPHLVMTTDGGATWQDIKIIENVETTVNDLLSHPSDSDLLLAGMSGSIKPSRIIRKSTDSGQSWQTVLEGIGVYTLTHSARNPEVVYAGGINPSGTLFFAASGDFGDTWQTVEMPDSPAGMQTNDIVSVMQNGTEVLYLGTNKGIYSYRFEN